MLGRYANFPPKVNLHSKSYLWKWFNVIGKPCNDLKPCNDYNLHFVENQSCVMMIRNVQSSLSVIAMKEIYNKSKWKKWFIDGLYSYFMSHTKWSIPDFPNIQMRHTCTFHILQNINITDGMCIRAYLYSQYENGQFLGFMKLIKAWRACIFFQVVQQIFKAYFKILYTVL